MENKDNDNIDEDEWYAGLGVVPLSSEKTSGSALTQSSPAMVLDSGVVPEADSRDREGVLEEGARYGVMPGVSDIGSGDAVMHEVGLSRDLVGQFDYNQRDASMTTANVHMEGLLVGSKQVQGAFDVSPGSEALGLKAGQEAVEFQNANLEDYREMTAVEEDDEDLGGVILADEVNSRSYASIPYGKGVSIVSRNSKPVSFVRRDRVVFLGSPPELPLRLNPDSIPGGAVTRVGPIVIISNLMWWINDIHVRELAAEFGTIRAMRIVERPKDGRSLGICLIEYVSSDSTPKALQGISASFASKFEGRPLYVVPLPLHGELHIALDSINPHWSRGGVITEEVLAMICQLVGVDIQTAGLEIQPETGTIVGLVQPRFADYASYYFPDGTPSWFPPLYVEALKHLRDLIPPAKLQNRSYSGVGEAGVVGAGDTGVGGSSSSHSSHKSRSNYANNAGGVGMGGVSGNYMSMENESEDFDRLENDFAGGLGGGDFKDSTQSYSGCTKPSYISGDQSGKGLKKSYDNSSGQPGSSVGSFNNITSKNLDESYQYNSTSSGGGGRGGRGSKSLKYDHDVSDSHSGVDKNRESFASLRDEGDYLTEGGGGAMGSNAHNNKKTANQRRDYNRDKERGDRGERERYRDRGERDRYRDRDRERNKERNKERNREKSEKYREKEREDNDRVDKEKSGGLYSKGGGGGSGSGSGGGGSSHASASFKESNERGGGGYGKKSSGGVGSVVGSLEHGGGGGASTKSSSKKHRSSSESSRSRSPQRRLSSKHVKKDTSKFSSNASKDKSWEGRGSGGNNNSSRGSKNSYRESRSLAERGGWDRRSSRR